MHESLLPFFLPASMMFLAEMGDKTQLLAIAFSSRYKPVKVLTAMLLSIFLLNGLAVAFGNVVSRYAGLHILIEAAAAAAFIVFGLLTLKPEQVETESQESFGNIKSSVLLTVFLTFFLAELGDKTQLTAISLAVNYHDSPLMVLFGTSIGMFFADSLGVIVGAVMLKKIPDQLIKRIAATVFLFFGLFSVWKVMTTLLLLSLPTSILMETIIILIVLLSSAIIIRKK
ncbi:MAG: TMEM165/GDT1 family protein [Clostridiales bacterium]|nr:TMEM165/GDT1 family protein [Clostridiales bacterium]